MNYRNIIKNGTSILKNNHIINPNIDAEILLSVCLKKSREDILLNLEDKISFHESEKYIKLINRRKNREPISQIRGTKFFWNSDFEVNKQVLTPRFETELLIEKILKLYKFRGKINILDAGIGSGCILVSLLKQRKDWSGVGVDISKHAIKTAKNNAKMQHVINRIRFINSDIDKYYSGNYDLVVSNPPYIKNIDYNNLDVSVKGYEPKVALCGGIDGFKIIEKVISKSNKILKNNGILAMEIGIGQKYKTTQILRKNDFFIFEIVKDYQNISRFILAKKIK